MSPSIPLAVPVSPRPVLRAWHCVMGTLLLALVLAGLVVWRSFQLGSETEVLRAGLMQAIHGKCEKKIALHVGMFSTALIRAGSRFFTLPPEPRAALESIHSVEFGVYEVQEGSAHIDAGAALASTDKAMGIRGWERSVGAVHEHQVVAVYVPREGIRPSSLKCCLVVLDNRNLFVLSARANLEPLIALAQSKLGPEWKKHLAVRVPLSGNVASNQR